MRLGRVLEGTPVACFEIYWSVREFVRQEMKVNHTILSTLDLRYRHSMEQMQHRGSQREARWLLLLLLSSH